jgi:hypothetical protein
MMKHSKLIHLQPYNNVFIHYKNILKIKMLLKYRNNNNLIIFLKNKVVINNKFSRLK